MARERRPFGALGALTDIPRVDCRRCGVTSDDVDLESDASPRGRGSVVLRTRLDGGVGEVNRVLLLVGDARLPSIGECFPSSSVHCKWRITDFVAHWQIVGEGKGS